MFPTFRPLYVGGRGCLDLKSRMNRQSPGPACGALGRQDDRTQWLQAVLNPPFVPEVPHQGVSVMSPEAVLLKKWTPPRAITS